MNGDNLWDIAAKQQIYSNAYHWPLVYKENQRLIEDADLIYPGQQFTINRNHSGAEIDNAASHAVTRGPWSLGDVEACDRRYLAQ